jgi:hypothetical protein
MAMTEQGLEAMTAALVADTRIALFNGDQQVSDWVSYGPGGTEGPIKVTSPGVTHVQVVGPDGEERFVLQVPYLAAGDEWRPPTVSLDEAL